MTFWGLVQRNCFGADDASRRNAKRGFCREQKKLPLNISKAMIYIDIQPSALPPPDMCNENDIQPEHQVRGSKRLADKPTLKLTRSLPQTVWRVLFSSSFGRYPIPPPCPRCRLDQVQHADLERRHNISSQCYLMINSLSLGGACEVWRIIVSCTDSPKVRLWWVVCRVLSVTNVKLLYTKRDVLLFSLNESVSARQNNVCENAKVEVREPLSPGFRVATLPDPI